MKGPPTTTLLFVDAKMPTPTRDAASQRSMQLLAQFVRWGFEVEFAAVFPVPGGATEPLDELGVRTLPAQDVGALREHLDRHPSRYEIVVLCWTRVASRLIDAIRDANPNTFVVFDTVDVNHVREYRHARVSRNARILRRALVTKQRELDSVAAADCTLAVTDADAQTLRAGCPQARVEVVTLQAPSVAPIPGGDRRERQGTLFLGNLQAQANVDAALHLVHDVLPELRKLGGETLTTIAGGDPPDAVSSLAGAEIRVTGHVEKLRPLFDEHLLFACPLRFGSGIKGKLLWAMAAGLPAVVTPVAAEGMALTDEREVLVAETPRAYAAAMLRLQREPALRRRLAAAAREHVRERHGGAVLETQMRRVFSPR